MKYFGIIDKNVAAIFQLQWKIGNFSDMFLQYSVLCGIELKTTTRSSQLKGALGKKYTQFPYIINSHNCFL